MDMDNKMYGSSFYYSYNFSLNLKLFQSENQGTCLDFKSVQRPSVSHAYK